MESGSRQLTMLLNALHMAGGEEDVAEGCWTEGSAGSWSEERSAVDYLNFEPLISADASVQFPA